MRSGSTAIPRQAESSLQTASWGRRLILGICGAILVFAPLAYGAVHPWAYFSIGLVTTLVSLTLLGWLLYRIWLSPDETLTIPYPPLWWLAVGLVILTAIQLLPLPQGLLAHLSPKAWEIRSLGNGFGLADFLPLSLNPYATMLEGLKLWPAVVLFFTLIYTINSRRQLEWLVRLILAVALFEVFYGFWNFHTSLIWGWQNPYTGRRLCGTFINSDQLATFLTMAILLGFGLFLGFKETPSGLPGDSSGRARIRRWSRSENLEPQSRRFFLLFILMLLVVGLIFTGSRGGMASLLMGFGLMVLLIWGQQRITGYVIILLIFGAAAILYSLFLGSSQILGRFFDLNYHVRYQAFKGALAIFKEFPILGSGIATFGDVFYRYEPVSLKGWYFIQAHSDWLQLLAETGLVGFSLVVAAGIAFFSVLTRQLKRRRQGFAWGLTLGGGAALAAASFHALVEFPFHIPAISLMLAAIAAITYLSAHYHHLGEKYFSYPVVKVAAFRTTWVLILLCLLGVQAAFVFVVWDHWSAERIAPTEIDSTRPPPKYGVSNLRRALALNPATPQYYWRLAEVEGEVADDKELPERERLFKDAILRAPANWAYRLKLADFSLLHYQKRPAHYLPMALKELSAAVELFPESGKLHFRLGSVLNWADHYFYGLVPPELQGRGSFHLQRAIVLEPGLQKFQKKFREK